MTFSHKCDGLTDRRTDGLTDGLTFSRTRIKVLDFPWIIKNKVVSLNIELFRNQFNFCPTCEFCAFDSNNNKPPPMISPVTKSIALKLYPRFETFHCVP